MRITHENIIEALEGNSVDLPNLSHKEKKSFYSDIYDIRNFTVSFNINTELLLDKIKPSNFWLVAMGCRHCRDFSKFTPDFIQGLNEGKYE
jgi:hypothetical protein